MQLREHYKDDPEADRKIREAFTQGRIQQLKDRINNNGRVDRQKSKLVGWSYGFTGLSVVLNLTTLVWLALH